MIAGHFGFAALVKARERSTPLMALMLATVWLDVIFVPLFLAGIETIEAAPGTHGGYGAGIIHADYTHSLLGALALSVLFAALYLARCGRRVAMVLGLVAFSHWVLDLLVHRSDLPLLPGHAGAVRLGFGLWRAPWAAAALEALLVVIGAACYFQAARAVSLANAVNTRQATLASALILAGGLVLLAVDFSGVLG
jgi:hypothetical protein